MWRPRARRECNFAHGQMNEHQLEKIMLDFINGEVDVLRVYNDHRDRAGHSECQHDDHSGRGSSGAFL